MKKYFLTCAFFPKESEKYKLFYQYSKPRIQEFCKLHGFKHLDVNLDNFQLPSIFKQIPSYSVINYQFARWYVIDSCIKENLLKDDDIVNYTDTDVYIVQPKVLLQTNKSYSYAIDSGNTHCTGIFSLKINDFTKKLISSILSQERYDNLKDYLLYNEDAKVNLPFYYNDQQAYYHVAGIKPHSSVSFLEMPDYGFHSYKTDHTIFTVEELLQNVELLGPEWNTTHLVEETGDNGKPNYYDIVRTTKDKVINRHFAASAPRLYTEWEEYSKRYDN
jgi:hypothetical protein